MSVLPDVLAPSLAVVFCGSAVGAVSARRRAYYAGPGNAFWPTLSKVGLTPRQLAPEEYRSVTKYGLGLTDLAKTISGSDHVLRAKHFDREGLRAKMLRYHPRVLAFTSKRAAEEFIEHPVDYGLLRETIGDTTLFVLPSPSGAARRYWSERPWRELARL
jgi:double-stranded uracil-DNA glycosylase